jgi:hypothetical protein
MAFALAAFKQKQLYTVCWKKGGLADLYLDALSVNRFIYVTYTNACISLENTVGWKGGLGPPTDTQCRRFLIAAFKTQRRVDCLL